MRKDLTESEQSKFYPKRTLLWLSLLGGFPYPNSAQPILLTIQIPALNRDPSHNSLMSSCALSIHRYPSFYLTLYYQHSVICL